MASDYELYGTGGRTTPDSDDPRLASNINDPQALSLGGFSIPGSAPIQDVTDNVMDSTEDMTPGDGSELAIGSSLGVLAAVGLLVAIIGGMR